MNRSRRWDSGRAIRRNARTQGQRRAPHRRPGRSPVSSDLGERVILEFAEAEDVGSGMKQVVRRLCEAGGADRVEWWCPTDAGRSFQLEVFAGDGHAPRTAVSAGGAGTLVVETHRSSQALLAAVHRLAPVLRRRWAEEQLMDHVARLARRNSALEDFASLVAHELKTPLQSALLSEDPSGDVERALDLVDAILEVACSESANESQTSAADCLDEALRDLGPIDAHVAVDLPSHLGLPPSALRVLMRNLLANAVAAGAGAIRVSSLGPSALVVEDDGVGLSGVEEYSAGSGIGLSLSRRLAERFGATIELAANPLGGTRAILMLERARP